MQLRQMTEEYSDYLRDESRTVGQADTISFPKTVEEVADIVRYCYEHDILVNIQGARTGLAGGASPAGGNILNFSRMNRILGLRYDDAQDQYLMRIQPGVLLLQVRKALENKSFVIQDWDAESIEVLKRIEPGQLFFAPDPTEPTASLGGMAACNASGSRSLLYGPVRDHVEAATVVLATGEVTHLRRGEVKAQGREFSLPLVGGGVFQGKLPDYTPPKTKDAGFFLRDNMDMLDLFIGSQGTLGVIAELEVKLTPMPRHFWGVTAFMPSDQAAINYVRILRGENLPGFPAFGHKPAAIEYFDKMTLNMVVAQKAITPAFQQLQELPEVYETAIYAEFNEPEQSEERFLSMLAELAEVITAVGGNPADTWVAEDERELEKLIFFRHTVPETVNLRIDQERKEGRMMQLLSADMAVPDEYLLQVYEMYHNDMATKTTDWIMFGHIGETHFHPDIFCHTPEELAIGTQIFENWARQVRAWGGTITAEHGAGKLKRNLALIMYGEETTEKLRAFKRTLDDKCILSPGNIVF